MNIDFLDLDKIKIDKDHLFNVRENIKFNEVVLKHYKRLLFSSRYYSNLSFRKTVREDPAFDGKSLIGGKKYTEKVLTMENKLSNLRSCNSFWLLDVHDQFKVKDFIKTNLCKDRFCSNCKKVKQASRMARFIPEVDKYKDKSLYHLTLTVPNVCGEDLRKMISIMFKSFTRLINYFNPARKKEYVSGVDFDKYNYLGAIRSLEVTYKSKSAENFHPHIHCLLALDYDPEQKVHVNDFSKKHGKIVNKFSDTEILVQKVWKLLVLQEYKQTLVSNNQHKIDSLEKHLKEFKFQAINKKTIDRLPLGFSSNMDLFKEDDYHELFKYMTKATNDDGDSSSFQDFLHLYFQLKSVRQIQGYGVFFRIKDEDMEDDIDLQYDTLKSILDSLDPPRISTEKTEELILDQEYTLISRKKIYGHLRDIEKYEKEKEGCDPSLKNG